MVVVFKMVLTHARTLVGVVARCGRRCNRCGGPQPSKREREIKRGLERARVGLVGLPATPCTGKTLLCFMYACSTALVLEGRTSSVPAWGTAPPSPTASHGATPLDLYTEAFFPGQDTCAVHTAPVRQARTVVHRSPARHPSASERTACHRVTLAPHGATGSPELRAPSAFRCVSLLCTLLSPPLR